MTRPSSYLLGSGLAGFHHYTLRVGASQLRLSTPLLSAKSFNRPRALHLSRRSPPYLQWLQNSYRALPQGILFWTLLTSVGISYSIYNVQPSVLENDEAFHLLVGPDGVKQKYLSPTPRLTVEHANEALRRLQGSSMIGAGSGVIRLDTMQLQSNPILEDMCRSTLGYEDDEVKWMLFGIYDGHA